MTKTDIAYNTYKRSFRTRFETSISSGTRNYTFDYPADWEEGASRIV